MIKNKILIFIFIFFLIITKNHNSKAGILDFFSSDPWVSGCVYDPFGNKIGCSKYNYNEAKNPGSKRIAENNCLMELKKIQIEKNKSVIHITHNLENIIFSDVKMYIKNYNIYNA